MKWLLILLVTIILLDKSARADAPDSLALSLEQALSEALAHNDLLKKSEAQIAASKAVLQQAKGQLLPQVNANLTYAYLDIVPGFRSEMLGNIEHDIIAALSISQPVYMGGKLQQKKIAAEAGLQSQKATFQNERLNLKYRVTMYYYQLQFLQNQIQILKENYKLLQTHQQYARLLIEAGRMSNLELDRIAVSISDLNGNILNLQNDYLAASYQLTVALGRHPRQTFIPADSLKVVPFDSPQSDLLLLSLEKNPAWKQLQYETKMAEANVRIQAATRMPQISAIAWYGYEFGLESFSFNDNKRYFIGLNAQLPIYTGGVMTGKIEQARSGVEQLKWQREFFKKTLDEQLKNSHNRLKEMSEQIAIYKNALSHARKSYRLALIEYHAGRRSNTDLLDIQKSLLNSQLTLNEALVNYNKSKANLLYLIGIL